MGMIRHLDRTSFCGNRLANRMCRNRPNAFAVELYSVASANPAEPEGARA